MNKWFLYYLFQHEGIFSFPFHHEGIFLVYRMLRAWFDFNISHLHNKHTLKAEVDQCMFYSSEELCPLRFSARKQQKPALANWSRRTCGTRRSLWELRRSQRTSSWKPGQVWGTHLWDRWTLTLFNLLSLHSRYKFPGKLAWLGWASLGNLIDSLWGKRSSVSRRRGIMLAQTTIIHCKITLSI